MTSRAAETRRNVEGTRELGVYLGAGIFVGILYAVANGAFDFFDHTHRIFTGVNALHLVIDRVLPVVTGALLGAAIYAWRLRARHADREAVRADTLARRLRGVERDQAVWVVATAALHDVLNPLHALGLLLDELADTTPETDERSALLARARVHVDRVRASIGEMRKLADAAPGDPVGLSLAEVAREVAAAHAGDARKQGTAVQLLADDVRVRVDPLHVRIVVDALLTNALDALRHAQPGGRGGAIRVELAHEGNEAVLRVCDDGPGIPSELRGRVFDPLATTKTSGLGLGLPIARALARSMGGELALIDRDDWRTAFEMRLPVSTLALRAPAEAP